MTFDTAHSNDKITNMVKDVKKGRGTVHLYGYFNKKDDDPCASSPFYMHRTFNTRTF